MLAHGLELKVISLLLNLVIEFFKRIRQVIKIPLFKQRIKVNLVFRSFKPKNRLIKVKALLFETRIDFLKKTFIFLKFLSLFHEVRRFDLFLKMFVDHLLSNYFIRILVYLRFLKDSTWVRKAIIYWMLEYLNLLIFYHPLAYFFGAIATQYFILLFPRQRHHTKFGSSKRYLSEVISFF